MSQPDRRQKHLFDIEKAIQELQAFSDGRSLEQLLTDRALQLIFEREFEIMGEAMNRLLREYPDAEPLIGNARRIIGLRNILAHGYDTVDYSVLWAAVVGHLPRLKQEIDNLIQAKD